MGASSHRWPDHRRRARISTILALCLIVSKAALAQGAQAGSAALERLTALDGQWQAGTSNFRSTLHFQRSPAGGAVRAWNEVTGADGRTAFYEGTYFWDPGRMALRFVTVASSGELHEGEVYWRGGMLWHDARVSGSSLTSYRSSLRLVDGTLEYRAVYGTLAPDAEVLAATPLVYRRVSPPPA